MIRKILTVVAGLTISAGMTWAGTLDQNPGDFTNKVLDWCTQFGCVAPAGPVASGTSWASMGTDTGEVGLVGTNLSALVVQQDPTGAGTWAGNFSDGMGGIWNNKTFFDIALNFDQGELGAGAYVQADFFGAFTATITLFDIADLPLDTFTVNGVSNGNGDGSAIFLGAYETTAEVFGAEFSVLDVNGNNDFAIGQAALMAGLPTTGTPEPASMLLIAPALLGLAAFGRKRMMNSRRGNN